MGKVSFSFDKIRINQDVVPGFSIEIIVFFNSFLKNGHAFKAFLRRLFKDIFSKNQSLSGSTICPSYAMHTMTAALWTDADIHFPDCF